MSVFVTGLVLERKLIRSMNARDRVKWRAQGNSSTRNTPNNAHSGYATFELEDTLARQEGSARRCIPLALFDASRLDLIDKPASV
jgi:hypothetical protein